MNATKETNVATRIRHLQDVVQSYNVHAITGEYVINGLILDKIPIDIKEARIRINRELRELIKEEIERLQVISENGGDIPANEVPVSQLVSHYKKPEEESLGSRIRLDKALEFILSEVYFSRFQVIDNLNQDPQGLNFEQWLIKNKLLDSKLESGLKSFAKNIGI